MSDWLLTPEQADALLDACERAVARQRPGPDLTRWTVRFTTQRYAMDGRGGYRRNGKPLVYHEQTVTGSDAANRLRDELDAKYRRVWVRDDPVDAQDETWTYRLPATSLRPATAELTIVAAKGDRP